jgi:hypothetical protein
MTLPELPAHDGVTIPAHIERPFEYFECARG